MLTRRQFGITLASAIAAMPPGRTLAQTGHNPFGTAEEESSSTPEASSGWSAEVVEMPDFDGVPLLLSPDGTKLAGMTVEGYFGVLDLDSGEVHTDGATAISPEAIYLDWAPDSSQVVFAQNRPDDTNRAITLFDLATTTVTSPIPSAGVSYDDSLPAFSIDGGSIAFVRILREVDSTVSSIMELTIETGKVGMLAREVAGSSSFVYGSLHRLQDNSLVYAVNWNPDRAIDRTPGIWHLPIGEQPVAVLAVDAQSEHPHPYVLDALLANDNVFVLAADAGTEALDPISNGTTWVASDGETIDLLESNGAPDLPSPTTMVSFTPGTNQLLVATWVPDSLDFGILTESSYTFVASSEWAPTSSNPTYLHASWSTTNRVFLSSYDTPGLLLQVTPGDGGTADPTGPDEPTPIPACGCTPPADG